MKFYVLIKIISFLILLMASTVSIADISKYNDFIHGSLSKSNAEKEMRNFSRDFNSQRKNKKPLYLIYKQYVDKVGTKRIAEYLEQDSPSCHGVAHGFGRLIGERVEGLNASMGICGSTCTYACLHGVFKVYFNKLGQDYGHHAEHGDRHNGAHNETHSKMHSDKNMKHQGDSKKKHQKVTFSDDGLKKFGKDVNKACDESNSIINGFYKGNCAHGVGHAMGRLAQDVPLANKYCEVFSGDDMRFYCETGVFMEYGDKLKKHLFKGKLRRSEEIKIALKYCAKESAYPSSCLRFLLPRNKSLGHVSRFAYHCSKQGTHLKNHCYNALGYYSRTYVANNPEEFPYVCSSKNNDEQKSCISGIALMKKGQRYREKIKLACVELENKQEQEFCENQSSKYYYKLDNSYLLGFLTGKFVLPLRY